MGIADFLGGCLGVLLHQPIRFIEGWVGFQEAMPLVEILSLFGQSLQLHSINPGEPSLGIFVYSTLFTSVWIWLYAAATALLKLWSTTRWGAHTLFGFLDIDEKPFQSIGLVINLLITLGFVLLLVIEKAGII